MGGGSENPQVEPTPIITVYLTEKGDVGVQLRPTRLLGAEAYGPILCALARQVAKMYAMASDGKFDEEHVLQVILEHFDQERAQPRYGVEVHSLNG